jgi:polyribonucleotide nucleotidyltransferase
VDQSGQVDDHIHPLAGFRQRILAQQAAGAVTVQMGDTMMFSAVKSLMVCRQKKSRNVAG